MKGDDDHTLIRMSLAGDPRAREELVERYYKTIFNASLRIVRSAEDAADVTQDVFVKAFDHLRGFKFRHKFFSWLYRIAVNESLNHIRQRDKFTELDDSLPSDQEDPAEALHGKDIGKRLDAALQKLKLDYRVVVVLYHFQELTYHEISYVLDIPEKTVKSRLYTARWLLRNLLNVPGAD